MKSESPYNFQFDNYWRSIVKISNTKTIDEIFKELDQLSSQRKHIICASFWLKRDILPSGYELDDDGSLYLFRTIHGFENKSNPEQWTYNDKSYYRITEGEKLIMPVAQSGKSTGFRDVTKWQRPQWAVDENIRSAGLSPLISGNRIIGVFATFMNRDIDPEVSREVFSLQNTMADIVASSLINIKAFKEINNLKDKLERENRYLQREIEVSRGFDNIIGRSTSLIRVLEELILVSETETPVLIQGETGTGKEMIAKAIHKKSRRCNKPFISVNCSTIPENLFESEFFGHVKGSFTGAEHDRAGRFELADEGTLFLDEIGEIPLELQSKLLRILQEGTYERVGESKTRTVDVRIIAATNRDLKNEISLHRFREDLYFRINVFPLQLPPLRNRKEDIPLLINYFLEKLSRKMGKNTPFIDKIHLNYLVELTWPGNIRELQNYLEYALIMTRGEILYFNQEKVSFKQKNDNHVDDAVKPFTRDEWIEMEKENIILALDLCHWRVGGESGAAELLKMRPTTLYSRIKALDIKR